MAESVIPYPFDAETWAQLPSYFDKLPDPVWLVMWGNERMSQEEMETAVLLRTLAEHFTQLNVEILPRRINYPFYPVIGIMGAPQDEDDGWQDYRVRFIGQPKGYQLTTLITAIQVVSFRAQTLEPRTRILLSKLTKDVTIEILTAEDLEVSALNAKAAYGLAVANPHVQSFVIMADQFPQATMRYSASYLPHTVINRRIHVEGSLEEGELLQKIAQAVK